MQAKKSIPTNKHNSSDCPLQDSRFATIHEECSNCDDKVKPKYKRTCGKIGVYYTWLNTNAPSFAWVTCHDLFLMFELDFPSCKEDVFKAMFHKKDIQSLFERKIDRSNFSRHKKGPRGLLYRRKENDK